jgi:mono/diheme cytochrome c family protein
MRIGNNTTTDAPRPATLRRRVGWLLAACGLAFGAGCRRDMYDQPRYEAYEPSTFFADGTSSRQPVAGTIARGELRADLAYFTGKTAEGKDTDVFPMKVDRELIELGRERYLIYCSPCHGRVGDGRGMVVRRGFSPPPTFHTEYLRKIPVGHIYNVITNGYGAMYSYAARVPVRHRWAIAAYVRTLQYSQDANPEDLSPAERKALAEAGESGPPTPDDRKQLAEVKK